MPEGLGAEPKHALAMLQNGLFVLTARFETKRAGVVVRSVQPVSDSPPLVCVAVRRGHWIEPVIRDSHAFAVCKVTPGDGLMLRKFGEDSRPRDGDPFDCVQTTRLATGSPILVRPCRGSNQSTSLPSPSTVGTSGSRCAAGAAR